MRTTIFDLVNRSVGQAGDVALGLSRLALAEVGDSVGSLVKGAVFLVLGLGTALVGILFLLHAAVSALVQHGWSEAASYGLVGGVAALLSLLAFLVGYMFLRNASPIPHRAFREVQALFAQRGDIP